MALSVLIGFAGVFGAAEGIRASQHRSKREEHRSRKNNLSVHCPKSSEFSARLEGRQIVLSGDKLYVDTGTAHDVPFGHPFAGYYLAYPDAKYSGLVSSITDEAPIMNWIYVDKDTFELKFGNRQFAEPNLNGPWDCTRQDRRLTFGGWEGFVAVQEGEFWAIYFDLHGDNLKTKVAPGTPVIEIEVLRTELRVRKPPPPPPPEETNPEGTPNGAEQGANAPEKGPMAPEPEKAPTAPEPEKAPITPEPEKAQQEVTDQTPQQHAMSMETGQDTASVAASQAPMDRTDAWVATGSGSRRASRDASATEASIEGRAVQEPRGSDAMSTTSGTSSRGRRGRRPKGEQQKQKQEQQKQAAQKQEGQIQERQPKKHQQAPQYQHHRQLQPQPQRERARSPPSPTESRSDPQAPTPTRNRRGPWVEIVADVEEGHQLPDSPDLD